MTTIGAKLGSYSAGHPLGALRVWTQPSRRLIGLGHSEGNLTYTKRTAAARLLSLRIAVEQSQRKAEVHLLEAGHFALDEATDQIASLVRNFLEGTNK